MTQKERKEKKKKQPTKLKINYYPMSFAADNVYAGLPR